MVTVGVYTSFPSKKKSFAATLSELNLTIRPSLHVAAKSDERGQMTTWWSFISLDRQRKFVSG